MECEIFLGVLTIPKNIIKRNFARNTWIPRIPTNVCYSFLYDKGTDILANERFDGLALNSSDKGIDGQRGEKLYNLYSYINKTKILTGVKYIIKMDDDVVLCPEKLFDFLRQKILSPDVYSGWFHHINELPVNSARNEFGNEAKILGEHLRADAMFVMLGRPLMNYIVSKQYCNQRNEKDCNELNQLYDTNMEGTSLAKWLSALSTRKIQILPLNDIAMWGGTIQEYQFRYHSLGENKNRNTSIVIYHLGRQYNKNTRLLENIFSQCPFLND